MERLNVTPSDCKKVEQLQDYWKALAKKDALTLALNNKITKG